MEVCTKNFPRIMRDNDLLYMHHLQAVIDSVDEYASLEVTKTSHSYHFRVIPSVPRYTQSILNEILKLNNVYGIRLELSKSIRTSSTINFDIELDL